MSGLQEAFYIIGIIFMGVMLVLILFILTSLVIIRSKINRIHDQVEEKIHSISHIAEKGGELAALATGKVVKKARKATGKSKRK